LKARPAAAAVSLLLAACVGPPVRFFAEPPPQHAVYRPFADTVLLVRHEPDDSVSAANVAFAFDVLDRAEAAGEPRAARVLRRALETVPRDARIRSQEPGEHDSAIYRRVQGQNLALRFEMMRADVLVIRTVATDTVEVEVGEGENAVVERWLALVFHGDAAANPAIGIR